MELTNIDTAAVEQLYKKASISLCSNIAGQVTVGLMLSPPEKGEPSYDVYHQETAAIYGTRCERWVMNRFFLFEDNLFLFLCLNVRVDGGNSSHRRSCSPFLPFYSRLTEAPRRETCVRLART